MDRHFSSIEGNEMSKKKVDPKTIIVGIVFFIFVIIGCILIFADALPGRNEAAEPEYLPLQVQGWESHKVQTLCLEINQSYPEEWFGFFKETIVKLGINITPRQFEFPYEEIITEIMQQIDVQVVSDDAQCDAALELNVSGTASSSTYGNIITKRGNSVCYAGSSVSGTLTLTAENQEAFSTPIRGGVSTPDHIYSSSCPDQPYDAPFEESSAEALTEGLTQLWGPEIAEIIRNLYRTGNANEEAMYDAANLFLKGEDTTNKPTVPAAEPATIETTEPSP
jgi:hypothetical protein